jgi:hypothetical protein
MESIEIMNARVVGTSVNSFHLDKEQDIELPRTDTLNLGDTLDLVYESASYVACCILHICLIQNKSLEYN